MSHGSWQRVRLEKYCLKIGSGSTPRGGEQVYQSNGIALIRSQNIYNGVFSSEGLAFLNDEEADRLNGVTVIKDDVLLNITGDSVARCCQVPATVLPARVNQHVAIVRPQPDEFDAHFLKYFFISPFMQSTMLSLAGSGGTRKALTKEMIQNFEIPKPPLPLQKKIASLLSTYDDLIENNRRRMALLEEAVRLLYREWFVHFRFPGHEHTRIVDGVPEGWRQATAFDSMQIMSGGTPKTTTSDFWDGETPFYTPKDSVDEFYVLDTEKHVTELGLNNCNSKLYQKDTIFITARGTVGNLNLAQRPMAMNQSCYALLGQDGILQKFLFCAMRETIQHFQQHAVGAVFDAIIVDTFKLIPFIVPEKKLMKLFENEVEPIFRQAENLLLQNQKLKAARELLLPRLMNGEIAV